MLTPALSAELPPLRIRGKTLLPIVQGGMGVGISAHRLAGSVASLGAVGTLSSVDLRRHHPDLMQQTGRSRDKAAIDAANLVALDREVRAALALAQGNGMIAINVMRAVSEYAHYVRQSCESGVQAIVVGAGLPLDLPEMVSDFPDVALIPILSDSRGIAVVVKRWQRRGRLPDAIVIEHPRYAGGHLGAAKIEDLADPRFDFPRVIEETFALFADLGIGRERIPLIPAGGINSSEKVRELFALGAAAVQVGTPFAVTEESDAHPNFKKILAEAKPEDIVTFMSVAGLPARAVRTPWLEGYLAHLPALIRRAKEHKVCTLAFDCLEHCGLRDGNPHMGQFCIDNQLAAALKGDVKRGLFFRGSESLPFGSQIRPARELIAYLLGAGPAPA
ncbi:MAG: 2-nitropropane dioxygenase [Betaproteobacteria bacterium RBG_16_64_18]|nr:MAG: 2-nitropropane dioxygenase [Betaproteobacteria bacterium RBG_16_64_18]OGA14897.1 MAG: 2-nitropropane dioxygenase [Betaproteobacteria bacterium RIFCSPLOWO2_02_FULL_65_20]OGA36809.1 MAG: 2-nitropropane dioxygenase [Betaproteobacteria bacterium RIFCSPLOWO2_12_FULL_65_110]